MSRNNGSRRSFVTDLLAATAGFVAASGLVLIGMGGTAEAMKGSSYSKGSHGGSSYKHRHHHKPIVCKYGIKPGPIVAKYGIKPGPIVAKYGVKPGPIVAKYGVKPNPTPIVCKYGIKMPTAKTGKI
jgi:hypothetical protein